MISDVTIQVGSGAWLWRGQEWDGTSRVWPDEKWPVICPERRGWDKVEACLWAWSRMVWGPPRGVAR